MASAQSSSRPPFSAWRIGIAIAVGLVLGAVAAGLAAAMLEGDAEVMEDIDRHFERAAVSLADTEDEAETPAVDPLPGPLAEAAQVSPGVKRHGGAGGKPSRRPQRGAAKRSGRAVREAPARRWRGIHRIAPGTYVVDESLAADGRAQPKKYIRGVRAEPVERGGDLIGFRIVGVREASALYALGFRDEDILVAVNGYALTSIDNALLAASALRFADRYRVDVLRGGRTRALYYRID